MPLPLAIPLIAGGALAAGGLAGLAFGGQDPLRADDPRLNLPSLDQARGLFDDISDPSYGLAQLERLASRGTLTPAAARALLGQGAGALQVGGLVEADQARRSGAAFDAFSDFQLGKAGALTGLLGLLQQGETFQSQALLADRFQRGQRRDALFGSLASLGTGLLGTGLGAQGFGGRNG